MSEEGAGYLILEGCQDVRLDLEQKLPVSTLLEARKVAYEVPREANPQRYLWTMPSP